jgi:hypothetical protein
MMATKKEKVKKSKITEVCGVIEAPMVGGEGTPYLTSSVYIRRLSKEQRKALRLLFDGLVLHGAEIEGRQVAKPEDAIRWMLEQLHICWTSEDHE